jgi:hypothetical protein
MLYGIFHGKIVICGRTLIYVISSEVRMWQYMKYHVAKQWKLLLFYEIWFKDMGDIYNRQCHPFSPYHLIYP